MDDTARQDIHTIIAQPTDITSSQDIGTTKRQVIKEIYDTSGIENDIYTNEEENRKSNTGRKITREVYDDTLSQHTGDKIPWSRTPLFRGKVYQCFLKPSPSKIR